MAQIHACPLCSVRKPHWETEKFFGIRCKYKFAPMIVLKEHKDKVTDEEMEELKKVVKQFHPKARLNKNLDHVNDHWCIYLK